MKEFHGNGKGGLITPPSPRSLTTDSNGPRQRKKGSCSGRARGRSTSRGEGAEPEVIARGVESESSTTPSTYPPVFGRSYTPSLLDDLSEAEPDAKPLRKDSTDAFFDPTDKRPSLI